MHHLHELPRLAIDPAGGVPVVVVADTGDGECSGRVAVERRSERGEMLRREQVVSGQVGDACGPGVGETGVERRAEPAVALVPHQAHPGIVGEQRLDRRR